MNLDLRGKNALVCGSSRGIGKAAALEIAAMGANVTLVARTAEKLAEVKKELDQSQGQEHGFLIADFSNIEDLRQKVADLTAQKTIHILVNNTGGPPAGPITGAKGAEFQAAFHNHLICNHLLAQEVLEGMKKAGYGRIINVISTSVKQPLTGLGVSNTVRAAVANWAKTLANEVTGFGITVNNVLPGATATDRLQEIIAGKAAKTGQTEAEVAQNMMTSIPAGRFAKPQEVGAAIAFLASPAAAYISGINLPVDGGRTKSL
jgi:3-oxoacyl-[acyl-carrier protein] reductase